MWISWPLLKFEIHVLKVLLWHDIHFNFGVTRIDIILSGWVTSNYFFLDSHISLHIIRLLCVLIQWCFERSKFRIYVSLSLMTDYLTKFIWNLGMIVNYSILQFSPRVDNWKQTNPNYVWESTAFLQDSDSIKYEIRTVCDGNEYFYQICYISNAL